MDGTPCQEGELCGSFPAVLEVQNLKEYLKESSEVLEALQTLENGLSGKEAQERLEKYGKNKLKEGKKTPLIVRFLEDGQRVFSEGSFSCSSGWEPRGVGSMLPSFCGHWLEG